MEVKKKNERKKERKISTPLSALTGALGFFFFITEPEYDIFYIVKKPGYMSLPLANSVLCA